MGLFNFISSLLGDSNNDNSHYDKSEKSKTTPSVAPATRKSEPREEQVNQKSKYASQIASKVADGEYIRNLRVGRSWILPQLVEIFFDEDGRLQEKGMEDYFFEHDDNEEKWKIAVRNYKAMAKMCDKDAAGYRARARWWTKETALAMARHDLTLLKTYISNGDCVYDNCVGGDYVYLPSLRMHGNKYDRMFFLQTPPSDYVNQHKNVNTTVDDLYAEFERRIQAIEKAGSPKALSAAVEDYNNHRCGGIYIPNKMQVPEYVKAFTGDGAYHAMMTMVKYLGLNLPGMTRDESIAEIERVAEDNKTYPNLLMEYCKEKFFDKSRGGVFDYKAYMKKA